MLFLLTDKETLNALQTVLSEESPEVL